MKAAESTAFVALHRLVRAVARRVTSRDRHPERYPINLRFVFELDNEVHQCFSRDLSTHGVFLNTDCRIDPGTEFELKFQLPGEEREVRCHGVVRHGRGDEGGRRRQGIGVEFKRLRSRDAGRLRRFLEYKIDAPAVAR